jgi:predicted ArsR family transcriptional regulator
MTMAKKNKSQTKKAQLIKLLSVKAGADVPTISEKLGWLPHTTRAALSGLRKTGYELTSEKAGNGKPTRYRVIASPATETM